MFRLVILPCFDIVLTGHVYIGLFLMCQSLNERSSTRDGRSTAGIIHWDTISEETKEFQLQRKHSQNILYGQLCLSPYFTTLTGICRDYFFFLSRVSCFPVVDAKYSYRCGDLK